MDRSVQIKMCIRDSHYIDEEYDKSREDEDRLERLEKEIAEYRKRYEGKPKQKCQFTKKAHVG